MALIATAGVAVLLSACGAGTPATAASGAPSRPGGSTQLRQNLTFARCMRAHGVPSFPDPNSSTGEFDKATLGHLAATNAGYGSATRACQHLLPTSRQGGPTAAELQQARAQGLSFARCVRAHGVPNFPDPGSDGRIPDPATVGINQGSPKFEAANQACARYRPPYMPSNSAYNAYARTQGS